MRNVKESNCENNFTSSDSSSRSNYCCIDWENRKEKEKEVSKERKCDLCGELYQKDKFRCVPSFSKLLLNPFKKEILSESDNEICEYCYEKHIKPIEIAYEKALSDAKNIKTYPVTYQGKVSVDYSTSNSNYKSEYLEEKEASLEQLKVTAAYLSYDVIYDVSYDKETNTNGNYRFATWSAKGTMAHSI